MRAETGFELFAFVVDDPARNYDALPRPADAADDEGAELLASQRASWIVAARNPGRERHELLLLVHLHDLLRDCARAFDPRLGELVPFEQALQHLWRARIGAAHVARLLADRDGVDAGDHVAGWCASDDVQRVPPPAEDRRVRGEFGWMRWPIAAHLAWSKVHDVAGEVSAHAGAVADGLARRPATREHYRRLQRDAEALAAAAQRFVAADHR